MTTDQIATKFKELCEIKCQIKAIQAQRTEEEQALAVKYNVAECNRLRNELIARYQDQINLLMKSMIDIENEIGSTI